ncbi:hypothetical protein Dimus_015772, partial [Dionaea muscipula]
MRVRIWLLGFRLRVRMWILGFQLRDLRVEVKRRCCLRVWNPSLSVVEVSLSEIRRCGMVCGSTRRMFWWRMRFDRSGDEVALRSALQHGLEETEGRKKDVVLPARLGEKEIGPDTWLPARKPVAAMGSPSIVVNDSRCEGSGSRFCVLREDADAGDSSQRQEEIDAVSKRRNSRILRIITGDGHETVDAGAIGIEFIRYFEGLLGCEHAPGQQLDDNVICFGKVLSIEQKRRLLQPFCAADIRKALGDIQDDKTP